MGSMGTGSGGGATSASGKTEGGVPYPPPEVCSVIFSKKVIDAGRCFVVSNADNIDGSTQHDVFGAGIGLEVIT